MNYIQYLQKGDTIQAPMSDEQALAHLKEKDNQMAEAIKQNPSALDKAVQDYGEDAPSFIKHMIDVAAENQDEELLEILKPYAEQFNIMSFRCGGKVRAKVKKAKCGKKMEKGGEAPIKKEAKGGKPCPCTLHKVGGKLIEVDCNGVPVAKDGMKVTKFKAPAGTLPKINTQLDINPNLLGGVNYKNQYLFGNGGNSTTVNFTPTKQLQSTPKSKLDQYENLTADEAYRLLHGTPPEVIEQERLSAAEAAKANQKQTWKQLFDAGKVKYGGLTKEEALARQREMQAAKGFNVDLGKWGADGMWGNQSKSEWERYQAWKLDQERAANANLTRLESPVKGLTTTIITPNAMTASNPNNLALDKNRNIVDISKLTPGQALSLDNSIWNRYLQYTRNRILSSKMGGKLNYADYLK